MRLLAPFALAATMALATPVAAQADAPHWEATRDYAATYRVTDWGTSGAPASGGPTTLRIAWLAAERMLRVEPITGSYLLIEHATGRARMVLEVPRLVMEVPPEAAGGTSVIPSAPPPGSRFAREGTDTVAGHRCTVWRMEWSDGRGRACLTDEGVMLRGEGEAHGQRVGLEAVEVSLAPQDPARFRVPAGYQAMAMPGGAPLGAPPPGAAGAAPRK